MPSGIASICLRAVERLVEFVATFLYRELLKRNTLRPMQSIIKEPNPEAQRRLLRRWAKTKANEASYIQLAGGFLFTTVASCLQWPSTANGHWSASAFFYACMLLAFVAIVMGSQQMLVLPTEKPQDSECDPESGASLPVKLEDRQGSELAMSDKQHLQAIVDRLCQKHHDGRPNPFQVFALQAPMMLLASSVVSFLAGLCSVIFAPLARNPAWDGNAIIALIFGMAAIMCSTIFFSASLLMHGLFS